MNILVEIIGVAVVRSGDAIATAAAADTAR